MNEEKTVKLGDILYADIKRNCLLSVTARLVNDRLAARHVDHLCNFLASEVKRKLFKDAEYILFIVSLAFK